MATRNVTITIPVPALSAAERTALNRAFNADIVRILKRARKAGASITNWGAAASGTGRKKTGKKKVAKKKAAKKTTKKR